MSRVNQTAEIGSLVVVRDRDGEEQFVLWEDTDLALGRISVASPLGAALLGRGPGERVLVRSPGGVRPTVILRVDRDAGDAG